jgi:phytoene synthase
MPDQSAPAPRGPYWGNYASPADRRACRTLIRHGSRSFFIASLLLPKSVRQPAYAFYAFCRLADDVIDLELAERDAVDQLRRRLDGIYAGTPADIPADRALADTVRQFDVPRDLLDALIEGFAWDRDGRRFRSLGEVYGYSARVAGSVGAVMSVLMGVRDAESLARACDLGVAMQLTNIARDVGEDAAAGRVYLPLEWMEEAGIDPAEFLENPRHSPALAGVVERLLQAAAVLYLRAEPGIAALPTNCRPAIRAARMIYAEIGAEIAANGFDSMSRRAVVSKGRKLTLLARAAAMSRQAPVQDPAVALAPALVETQFLVQAAAQPDTIPLVTEGIDAKFAFMIDLFKRLEVRDRIASPTNRES